MKKHLGLNVVDGGDPISFETLDGQVKGFSRPSPDRSSQNQDSFGIVETKDGLVLMVCDGMGGHDNGDKASSSVVKNLIQSIESAGEVNSTQILDAIDLANTKLLNQFPNSGTTLCLAHLSGDGVRFYSVGDSLGFLLSGGQTLYKTSEQTVAGVAIEAGLMDEQQAESHPEGHHLLNCLGDESPNVEVSTLFEVNPGDLLVLCSDGFSQSIDHKGFESQSHQVDFDEFFEFMLKHSFDGMEAHGHYDDITFVAFQKNL